MRNNLKRAAILGLGWLFIILGIVGLFLPVLQGVLFLLIGLALLSKESRFVRRFLAYLRMRYPKLSTRIRDAQKRAHRWWDRVRGRGAAER